jgi:drug/metabolite transporter (DMT)-like permease
MNPHGLYIVLVSGIFLSLYWVFLANSYKYGDFSLVYPIARSAPVFIPILAFIFYRETLSPLGVIGILAVIVGVYIIPMKSLAIRNFIKPFSHLGNKAVMFAGLTALSLSIHHMIDKAGTRFFDALVYVWLINFVSCVILTPYITFSKRRRLIREEWRRNRWAAATTGILIMFSYSLIVFVMRFEKISYIISMRQLSIVFGVFLGNMLLKERYGLVRFIASCLIFLGVFCIGIAE